MKKGITRKSNLKHKKRHGFRKRMRSVGGRAIIRRRRRKKRQVLSA